MPPVIEQALRQGAALAISLSGGKDSQALLCLLAPWFRARGFAGQLFAIHADLGRAEWEQTPACVQELAAVARKHGHRPHGTDRFLTESRPH